MQEIEAYIKWLKENGAVFNSIDWPHEFPNTGRGAIATKNIQPNEPFLTIPSNLIIDPPLCRRAPDVGDFLSSHKIFVDNDEYTLSFYLCHEKLKGRYSFWKPYIDSLPKDTGSLYSCWESSELTELQDEFLIQEVKVNAPSQRRMIFETIYGILEKIQAPFKLVTNEGSLTFSLFCWALETVLCRSFGRRLKYISMVPLADNLNHNNVQTKYSYDGDKFLLFPSGKNVVLIDHEAFNSYGRRSNQNLLLGYGFALEDNEWDEVPLDLELPSSIPLFEKKKAFFVPNELVFIRFTKNKVPNRLLKFFRIVTATSSELDSLKGTYLQVEFLNFRNERATINCCYEELVTMIRSFPTTEQEDEDLLKRENIPSKRIFAVRYRLGRKKCLSFSLSFLSKVKLFINSIISGTKNDDDITRVEYLEMCKNYLDSDGE